MSFISNVHAFNKDLLFDQIPEFVKENKLRTALGLVDPLSTLMTNTLLGRDDEAISSFTGAPSRAQFRSAKAKGIDTSDRKKVDALAHAIGAIFGGKALVGMGGGFGGEQSGFSQIPTPSMGGEQPAGNQAIEKVNLLRMMAELQRQQALRAIEQQRRQFGGPL